MFQDEAGFGRINKPKYCWCGEGIRSSVPCHHIREYRYAYGAVEPMTGDGYFLVMPYCNTVCMNIFLKQLSEHYSEDIILLCCDGAAWHIYTASDRNCRFNEYLYYNERDNSAANCFLKNISKVSAYKRPQRGSMTSCSPFLWNPGNPRCFFDAGHILIKKMAGKHPGTEHWKSAFAASAFSAGRTQKP